MFKYVFIISAFFLMHTDLLASDSEQEQNTNENTDAFSQLKASEQKRRERQALESQIAENNRLKEEARKHEEDLKREKFERRVKEEVMKEKIRDLEDRVEEQNQAIENMQSYYYYYPPYYYTPNRPYRRSSYSGAGVNIEMRGRDYNLALGNRWASLDNDR